MLSKPLQWALAGLLALGGISTAFAQGKPAPRRISTAASSPKASCA